MGLRSSGQSAFALIGAEAKQRRDIAHMIQCRFVLDEKQFNAAADRGGDDGFANIFQFPGSTATERTIADHMGVEMTATAAFDRVRRIAVGDQQSLYFAHFKGTQHPSQTGYAVSVTPGLTERFIDQAMPMLVERLFQYVRGLLANLLFSDSADVCRNPS
jgi:hypothetical protein